jgi:hypothetical protein
MTCICRAKLKYSIYISKLYFTSSHNSVFPSTLSMSHLKVSSISLPMVKAIL